MKRIGTSVYRHIGTGILLLVLCSAFSLKGKSDKTVYAFGMAASFNDTVVYYTDIQPLDSVTLDKNGFLPKREAYTYQLKNYLEYDLKKQNYTCMIYFSPNKGRLEKEAAKMKGKYRRTTDVTLQRIEPSAFAFKKPQEE